ncbi:sirohydrochlorin cobaltochelatase [Desulfogranum mediterraneum]|uniref:sirohydrochlorin cobaltochelatase n=1 Tax=Desulfogranum mediterraneum TaxID=160661 RepID=UPI0004029642|nr:sirohydrochlorin cobaltochelatase [Desulfogranum mediterraneum]
MKRGVTTLIVSLVLAISLGLGSALASGGMSPAKQGKTAIVLASFGTTVPSAVKAITNISDKVRAAYPDTEVRLTFTSNIIRSVWKKRQAEPQKWLDQGIPKEVLYVENIIATIGDLREDGYSDIIVQPTHMFFMEQSHDLMQYINGLASIRTMKDKWRPFNSIVMGRPALGMPGDRYEYHHDVDAAVATLAGDAEAARKAGATLVYMGHGNEHWSTGIYAEVQKKMRAAYPEVTTYFGVVEGMPALDDFMGHLKHAKSEKILLKPFMIVAGDHATNDMAGPEDDSWKSSLTKEGYQVETVLEGLGSNDAFAQLFVDHIRDAAKDHGLVLK